MNRVSRISSRRMRNVRCLRLAIGLSFSLACAVGQPQTPALPHVVPPSPDAMALGKYGSIPVSLHTGVPDISIPLYTVKSGALEVPISISYHASGVRVNEQASRIGLGWVLNAGGVVSRSVVGKCDEGGFWSTTIQSSSQITEADMEYLNGLAGDSDGETDFYFYNFNGRSGKFVYPQNSSTPFLIPKEPIAISYSGAAFVITDEGGVKYVFAAVEEIFEGTDPSFKSAFYLTEIISADGKDNIQFSYAPDGGSTEPSLTYLETIGEFCTVGHDIWGGPNPGHHTTNTASNGRLVMSWRLTQITSSTGKVVFVGDDSRTDAEATSRIAEVRVFGKNSDGTFEGSPRKTFVFGEGYFESPTGTSYQKYRLKLTNLTEKDAADQIVKVHTFNYEESVMLPHRASLAQDWWGYYNGQTSNTSLIKKETIDFNGVPYEVGGANREPNASTMQACILKKIAYPTGGYTEFDYEPHRYAGGTVSTEQQETAIAGQYGNTTTFFDVVEAFTPASSGWAKVQTHCSQGNSYYSRVLVRRQSNGQILLEHIYDPAIYSPFNPELTKDFWVLLTEDVTYELVARSQGTSTSTLQGGAAFSEATIRWTDIEPVAWSIAGGLRVKEIRDYTAAGATPIKKVYQYGADANYTGTLMTPSTEMSCAKQELTIVYNMLSGSGIEEHCVEDVCRAERMTISGRPAYDLTTLNGATVVYDKVTFFEGDTSAPNGKQVVTYNVVQDQMHAAPPEYNNGHVQGNNAWLTGNELTNTTYLGNSSTKVSEEINSYTVYGTEEITSTKVGWKVTQEGCFGSYFPEVYFLFFYYFDYPIVSGLKKLTLRKERDYSTATQAYLETQTDLFFENLNSNHRQMTKRVVLDSYGDTWTDKFWYPGDYTSGTENITSLLSKNIIGAPIKETKEKNGLIVSGKVSRPDDFGKPFEIHLFEATAPQTPPTHSGTQIVPSGFVKRASITYDSHTGKVASTQLSDHPVSSYVWGYQNQLPVAEAKNATVLSTAATFSSTHVAEAIVTGQVSNIPFSLPLEIRSTQSISPSVTVSVMGSSPPSSPNTTIYLKRADGTVVKSHVCTSWGSNSVGSISLAVGVYQWFYHSSLTVGGEFTGADIDISVTYQATKTGYTVFHTSFEEDGVAHADALTGKKVWQDTCSLALPGINGIYDLSYWQKTGSGAWTLVTQTVTVSSGTQQNLTIGTSGSIIDEVRLHPPGAMMTTYTLDTVSGMTSSTDANGRTTHYQYDAAGRLEAVKDSDRNIVKTHQYHYKQ